MSPKLSKRQHQIMRLVATGFTDKEIADHVGIATATVSGYIRVIFAKLSARNRCHAMFIWLGSPKLPD